MCFFGGDPLFASTVGCLSPGFHLQPSRTESLPSRLRCFSLPSETPQLHDTPTGLGVSSRSSISNWVIELSVKQMAFLCYTTLNSVGSLCKNLPCRTHIHTHTCLFTSFSVYRNTLVFNLEKLNEMYFFNSYKTTHFRIHPQLDLA